MISWLLYSLGVGAVMAMAAWVGEKGLAWAGKPTRLAWVAGMLGTSAMPVVA